MQLKKNQSIQSASELGLAKDKNKKGQTAVEFILLIALVAGIMTFVTPILDERITGVISQIVDSVNTVGWTGGYEPSSAEQPLNAHYDGSEAQMQRY
ncbi:class III signal peptide-containing protein [bacterium]|nr:class III signal peptide-containing protein [bacterium]